MQEDINTAENILQEIKKILTDANVRAELQIADNINGSIYTEKLMTIFFQKKKNKSILIGW